MLPAERQRAIIDLIERDGSVKVSALSRQFNVTEETVRRDLAQMEAEGRLERSHGGAVRRVAQVHELPYWEREALHSPEKMAIAFAAAQRIRTGDTIILDGSSTAWQVARLLTDQPLTVLTNALKVAVALAPFPQIRVICLGGTLSLASLSFVGPLAEENLEKYHAARLFISCKGVDLDRGLMDANEDQGRLRAKMMERAERVCLLADFSKFGVRALSAFADWSKVNELITDATTDPAIVETLRGRGVRVDVVNQEMQA